MDPMVQRAYGLQKAEDPHPSSQSRKLASEPSFRSFGFVVKGLVAVLQGWTVMFFCLKWINHTNANGACIITLGVFMHTDIKCIYLYSIHVCAYFLSISLAHSALSPCLFDVNKTSYDTPWSNGRLFWWWWWWWWRIEITISIHQPNCSGHSWSPFPIHETPKSSGTLAPRWAPNRSWYISGVLKPL